MLIFGVVIDTFGDLSAEKNKKEFMLQNTCFICGKCKEMKGEGGWVNTNVQKNWLNFFHASKGSQTCQCH